jgi:multicomponent K+:H+ antiporter subunit E
MSRFIPYPVLWVGLVLMWMLLTRFSLGHLLLGSAIALLASQAVSALQPERPRLFGWRILPRLAWLLLRDIARSNITVARLILRGRRSGRAPAFLEIPLRLQSQTGLASLAIALTATPGTAWVEYVSETGMLTLHLFDATEADYYVSMIRDQYEPMLQELFE